MLNPNYCLTVLYLWLITFPMIQVLGRWFDIQKAGAIYDPKDLFRIRKGEFWIYVSVAAAFLILTILVWVFDGIA